MQSHSDIRTGMTVRSRDGEKLGTVVNCEEETFTIEKGFFFPKDYTARYDYVANVQDTDVFLAIDKDDLASASERRTGELDETPASAEPNRGPAPAARPAVARDESSIPLAEDRIAVDKTLEKAGEVRVQKHVITEEQRFSVPVTHEEVRVEHVPVDPERVPAAGEASFQREEVRIPVHEERVEVHKTPVITEEVRIAKEGVSEQRQTTEQIRKEVAEVKKEGRLNEREVPPRKEG